MASAPGLRRQWTAVCRSLTRRPPPPWTRALNEQMFRDEIEVTPHLGPALRVALCPWRSVATVVSVFSSVVDAVAAVVAIRAVAEPGIWS